jgi:signal transduction histidine kinase
VSKAETLPGAERQPPPRAGLRKPKAGEAAVNKDISDREAVEIVRALRMAHADAFVSESRSGPVLSLFQGADEPYRIMVDTIGEGAVVVDPHGVVLFANPAMGRLVAKRVDELVGSGLGDHVSDGSEQTLRGSLPALMKGGTLDLELLRGAESVTVHLSARPIRFGGLNGAIVVATDYSELQQLTLQLEQRVVDRTAQLTEANLSLKMANERIVEADRLKTSFLANMSHELRTPLNAIIGFSELLLITRVKPYDAATQARFLEQILVGGKHLLGLINDILDLAKIESGQMELRPQSIVLRVLVDELVGTVEPLLRKKNLRVETSVTADVGVVADPVKLKQMVLNLISNAIKFTPDGGTVTIKAVRLTDSVEISVADTGIGIAESDQKLIFNEFLQLDNGPELLRQGTGLGLALTKRFALLHGGTVRVQSELKHGSVFTISLPLTVTAGQASIGVKSPVSADDAEPIDPVQPAIEDLAIA